MARSRVYGVSKLRRTLRRIEPAITKGVRDDVKDICEAVKWDAVERAPVDQGDLVRAIDYKIARDGLTAVVGPGARGAEIVRRKTGSAFSVPMSAKISKSTRQDLWQFYKGFWIEFGTKGDSKNNVPPQAPRPFMGPAWDTNAAWGRSKIRDSIRQALTEASR